YVDGAPDLVVEVLSPHTLIRDTRTTFHDYERFGVREYWIVNPDAVAASEFFFLVEGAYAPIEPQAGVVHSRVLPGLALDLAELEENA
ncbi:Uma2 family endonuclease, partial [Planctomycetota bacterium]